MTTCQHCGRQLRAQASIARRAGAACARRARQVAAVADVKAETVAKALEDVADRAIVDTRRRTTAGRRVYAVVSSTGASTYLATTATCTCRGGHRGRTCRHVVAARLIAA